MRGRVLCAAALLAVWSGAAAANDLYRPGSFSAMASDRSARAAGDLLTVIVYENSSARDSARSATGRGARLRGAVDADGFDGRAGLALDGGSSGTGSTQRAGQMIAQISVRVDAVAPGGDLLVSGAQTIHINRQQTLIRLRGRVRPADISPLNTVLSSRIADAAIDYDGRGFVSRSGRPGPVARLFNWLGLM